MVEIEFAPSFQRAYKKKVSPGSDRHSRFLAKVKAFMQDPFDPSLKTHKLSGKLRDYWSFSIEYDLRVVFYFEDDDTVVFFDLGTHDEVYD